MKKKHLNLIKLKQYSVLAGCVIAASGTAKGQIVYTDVSPDYNSLPQFCFPFDLNNDGSAEYELCSMLSWGYWGENSSIYLGGGSNQLAFISELPGAFEQGDTINELLDWGSVDSYLLAWRHDSFLGGNWLNQISKYVAVRFSVDGAEHYGWIRLSIMTGVVYFKVVIHDYAYESTPETMITAGDIGCVAFYADADNDGFGDVLATADTLCSLPVSGYSTVNTDCDDNNNEVNPLVTEIITNGIDDNCDGYIDEFGVSTPSIANNEAVLSLFPNPNDGNVTLTTTLGPTSHLAIKILDLAGNELYSENIGKTNGDIFSRQLDLHHFPSGTYLVQVIAEEGRLIKKIIVDK